MNFFDNINVGRFVGNLRYMGEGMLCIFIVIGVIILSIYGMNAISAKIEARKKPEDDE